MNCVRMGKRVKLKERASTRGEDILRGQATIVPPLLFLIGFAGTVLCLPLAWSQTPSVSPRARGVVIPCYQGSSNALAAVVRMQRIHADKDQRGFLRIGLLPIVAAEDVDVSVTDSGGFVQVLRRLEESVRSAHPDLPIVCRNVTFRWGGQPDPFLHAEEMRPTKGKPEMQLRHLTCRLPGAAQALQTARAKLDWSDPDKFMLVWGRTNRIEVNQAFRPPPALP